MNDRKLLYGKLQEKSSVADADGRPDAKEASNAQTGLLASIRTLAAFLTGIP